MGQRPDRLYLPRTPRDFVAIDRLVLCGASDAEIFRMLLSPLWRSECLSRGKNLFCMRCHQEIWLEFCEECGLPFYAMKKRFHKL